MQDHLVSVSLDQPVRDLTPLVRVHLPLGIIHIDEDITLLLCWRWIGHWMWGFGGAHTLVLIAHVALMGFL